MDEDAKVAVVDEFRDNEDSVVWFRGARKAEEENDVWVPCFPRIKANLDWLRNESNDGQGVLHQAPFPLKVLGDIVVLRG